MLLIYLSFDLDWAPPWATRRVARDLASAGVGGTFFVTHACATLPELRANPKIELGWHPNFLPGSSHGTSIGQVLDHMEALVPDARGARAHCLVRGTPFAQAYVERGLRYDASDLQDGEHGLRAFLSWTGLWRLPIFFEDDVQILRGAPMEMARLGLEKPGLKIFDLHPILVALNASSLEPYADLKADLRRQGRGLTELREDEAEAYLQRGHPGSADLLASLIAWLQDHPERGGGVMGRALPVDA